MWLNCCALIIQNGPPQYRSRTFFEDATPELVRDFFWDDEFRSKWDDMLAAYEIIEECSNMGIMVVKWIRKVGPFTCFKLADERLMVSLTNLCCFCISIQFPFFCSDREYIIGRRIWEVDGSYYCVTKVGE